VKALIACRCNKTKENVPNNEKSQLGKQKGGGKKKKNPLATVVLWKQHGPCTRQAPKTGITKNTSYVPLNSGAHQLEHSEGGKSPGREQGK